MWELWVFKFYLGQSEDYSLGDRLSYIAKELLPEGRGEVSVILVKGYTCHQATFWQRVATSHEEQVSLLIILVLFK